MAEAWTSVPSILAEYNTSEGSVNHLIELGLIRPAATKILRGEKAYLLNPEDKKNLALGPCWYGSMAQRSQDMVPFQRAILLFCMTRGLQQAYNLLSDRGIIQSNHKPAYFKKFFTQAITTAPVVLQKWIQGVEVDPPAEHAGLAKSFLTVMGIKDYWENPDLTEFSMVFSHPSIRMDMEGLLCTTASYSEIHDVLLSHHELDLSTEEIGRYHRLYFDREFMTQAQFNGYILKIQNTDYKRRLSAAVGRSFIEYCRMFSIRASLEATDTLDAMLRVEQKEFWRNAVVPHPSTDVSRTRTVAMRNSLDIYAAYQALDSKNSDSANERLRLEYEKDQPVVVLKRSDIDPKMINSATTVQSAGLDATSSRKAE